MKEIVLIGLNHKTAPVEVRECLTFSGDDTASALDTLKQTTDINEVMLFSTCNRIELLMTTEERHHAVQIAKQFLADYKNVPQQDFETSLYVHAGDDAVRHIFRVACSLDSMMVGEPQILGQIKSAYRLAAGKKSTGVILNRLLHKAFFVAKRVRSETGIGDHAVSISYAAIELGRKIFGSMEQKQVLLLGAGEMAELAVEHLMQQHVSDIFVANRTFERGVELAQRFKGHAIRFEEIADFLQRVDIIISSTGSPEIIITADDVKAVRRRRRNRPLFFIDIAVPRDIDPKINHMDNAYVYDIDDLEGIIEDNIEDRNREAVKGERIVDEAVIHFQKWYESLDIVPTIVALREKFDTIANTELRRTLNSMENLSKENRAALIRMKDALVNKILHDPTQSLKSNGYHRDKSYFLDTTRKLFRLDD
ncbi:MAG: glutamyl-tRNA reductase [Desulfobacterales bacterium]|nr:glutamyl-tRNA reductase [Desulfobacterales bacterium]